MLNLSVELFYVNYTTNEHLCLRETWRLRTLFTAGHNLLLQVGISKKAG